MNPTKDEVNEYVREAFDGVPSRGIRIREARAIEDRLSDEEVAQARREDVEEHWWKIPKEFDGQLGSALSFTDVAGFRFLLPAAMCSDDRTGNNADSVFYHLCLLNPNKRFERRASYGRKVYIDFLRSISAKQQITHYLFNQQKIHAIALFLVWWMRKEEIYLYANREKTAEGLRRRNLDFSKYTISGVYELTLEDEINNFDEICRILKEWLFEGGVDLQ